MTNWTWPAWTGSHKDFFTRNIITYADGSTSVAAVAERNRFASNAKPVPWPDAGDVESWIVQQGQTVGSGITNAEGLQEATEAARARISERVQLQVHPVDETTGEPDYDDLATVPPQVALATVMYAARLYRRRLSVDGTLGASAFGGAVRVGRLDPDIEALLANHVRVGLA